MSDLSHWAKFRPESLSIKEFASWIVVPRPKQVTVGSCVFLLKRPAPGLAELTTDELAELPTVAAWFESAVREEFAAEKFNYIAAMMKDPYFHLHAIPRYSAWRQFAGRQWEDENWPELVQFAPVGTSDAELEAVRDALRKY